MYVDPSGNVTLSFSGTSMGIEIKGIVSTTDSSKTALSINAVPDIVGFNAEVTKDLDEGEQTEQHGLVKGGGYVTDEKGEIVGVYGGLDLDVPGIDGMPIGEAAEALGKGIGKAIKALGKAIESFVGLFSPEAETESNMGNDDSEADNAETEPEL